MPACRHVGHSRCDVHRPARLKAPEVAEVVDRAAAPRQARLVLTRLLDAHPELADRLASDRLFVSALVALIDASRSLSEAVMADAGLWRRSTTRTGWPPSAPTSRTRPRPSRRWPTTPTTPDAACAAGSASSCCASPCGTCWVWPTCPSWAGSWRRWPRAASRRRCGLAEPAVAPTCGWPSSAWASSAGRELNYSSDVDVLFVHDGDERRRPSGSPGTLLTTMAQPTALRASSSAPTPTSGPRAGPVPCPAASTPTAAYWEKWAVDLGVPGAHQGPAGGRRRRPRPGVHRGGRAPRLAGPARPRRRPGGPDDEGPGGGGGVEDGA